MTEYTPVMEYSAVSAAATLAEMASRDGMQMYEVTVISDPDESREGVGVMYREGDFMRRHGVRVIMGEGDEAVRRLHAMGAK